MKDTFSLEGRLIVITGGAGFLGLQHAEAIALAGGTPVLLDLRGAEEAAAALSKQLDRTVHGLTCDITNEDALAGSAAWLRSQFGSIHGLVNNAANNPTMTGNPASSRLEHFDLSRWNGDLAVGLTGAFLAVKHLSPLMGDGGVILNVASDLGLIGPDQRLYRQEGRPEDEQPVKPVSYSAVKSGLIGLTRYLATYWPNGRIRCNAICPGGVENGQSEDFTASLSSLIPMGRMARPGEYGGLVVFLLGPASSYLNGAVIAADGGRTAW